jgi:hypothetical protein
MTASSISIDIFTEHVISLAQAAKLFPPARQEKPIGPNAVWHWVNRGVRLADGRTVRLEAIQVAGRWLTSKQAISRFIMAQQPGETVHSKVPQFFTEVNAVQRNAQAIEEAPRRSVRIKKRQP